MARTGTEYCWRYRPSNAGDVRFRSEHDALCSRRRTFIRNTTRSIEPVASRFPADCLDSTGNGRYLLDLGAAVLSQLEVAGVASDRCELAGECTFSEDTLFHSYRRDGNLAGRNVSIFGLRVQPDSRR